MLRSLKDLFGSTIHATDGELGHVHDFLFDDHTWTLRYFVVETAGWLLSRRVLLSPFVVGCMNWEKREVSVDLTQNQVRNSPDVDTAKPVSRQEEIAICQHYRWPAYWTVEAPPVPLPVPDIPVPDREGDPHLRSLREVATYDAKATDGDIGKIDDLIMDDTNWFIRYLVVSAGHGFSGQKLLLSTRWVGSISWNNKQVLLIHSRDEM